MKIIVNSPPPTPPKTYDILGLTGQELNVISMALNAAITGRGFIAESNTETAEKLNKSIRAGVLAQAGS